MSFQPPQVKRGYYYIVNLSYDLEFKLKEIIKKNPKVFIDCPHCEGMGCQRCGSTGRKLVRNVNSIVDAIHFYVGDEEYSVEDDETVDQWFTNKAKKFGGEELGSGGGFGLRDIDFMFQSQDGALSFLKILSIFDDPLLAPHQARWYHGWERNKTGDGWARTNSAILKSTQMNHQCDQVCQSLFRTCGLPV